MRTNVGIVKINWLLQITKINKLWWSFYTKVHSTQDTGATQGRKLFLKWL